jgi:large subunit ribosomal protein L7Ae
MDGCELVYQLLERTQNAQTLRRGAQESLLSIHKGSARLVIVAEDSTERMRQFVITQAQLKSVPFLTVPNRRELGAAAGLRVGAVAVAVLDAHVARQILEQSNRP